MKLPAVLFALALFTNLYGQTYPALEKTLTKELSYNDHGFGEDGKWVYYPDKAYIKKIEKPLAKAVLPHYDFYQVTLTNYLGYHVNQGTCVVLFDSLQSSIVLVEPLWYSDISEPFVKLFLKKPFGSLPELLGFLKEAHELMEIGSGYTFVNTSATDQLITYDLVYFKGDSYTTGGEVSTSTIRYKEDGISRRIEIHLKDLKPVEYIYMNPAIKDDKEYKDGYRKTIK